MPWLVVFDLDDTLIAEKDYQLSGISAVENYLESIYPQPVKGLLVQAHRRGVVDLWGYACDLLNLPSVVADSLLWVYRLHKPDLALQPGIAHLLKILAEKQINVVLLTDGRSISQRLKLHAVGLDQLPCFISEEWGSSKPDLFRFQAIASHWPQYRYVYIGDNPSKDFQAPLTLGWLTLGAGWTPDPVHRTPPESITGEEFQPHAWLKSPHDLLSWVI